MLTRAGCQSDNYVTPVLRLCIFTYTFCWDCGGRLGACTLPSLKGNREPAKNLIEAAFIGTFTNAYNKTWHSLCATGGCTSHGLQATWFAFAIPWGVSPKGHAEPRWTWNCECIIFKRGCRYWRSNCLGWFWWCKCKIWLARFHAAELALLVNWGSRTQGSNGDNTKCPLPAYTHK